MEYYTAVKNNETQSFATKSIEYLRAERVRHALKVGPAGLNNGERVALLSDPVALGRLHEAVWSEGHPEWLAAWRDSIKSDPHAPLLPLQPLSSQAQPA